MTYLQRPALPSLTWRALCIAAIAPASVLPGCQSGGASGQPSAGTDAASSTNGSNAVGAGASGIVTSGPATSSTDGTVGAGGGATNGSPTSSAVGTPSTTTTTATTTGGSDDCPEGAVQCPERCANLSTDFYNCGACGNECLDGQSCKEGVCTCGIGLTDCGSGCVDLNTSNEHCGACYNACPADGVCSAGVCGNGCLAQYTKCDGLCRDTGSDAKNCGTCGTVCQNNQVCRNGECGCGSAQLLCDGVCKNAQTDVEHCGACNNACQGQEWCADGFCLDDTTLDCGGARAGETCENYTRDVYNQYYVFNNLWGADENNVSGQQCVWKNCLAGDLIGWGTEWDWPNTGGVKSFTCLILGWHWGWVVPAEKTILPVQLNSGTGVRCGWNFDVTASGDFVIAYDLWTHSSGTPEQEDPDKEIMIWLYKSGNVAPLGSVQATPNIGGADWDLWRGPGGSTWEVFSYVRSSNTTNAVLNITDFTNDLIQRGWISDSTYLVSVEAGAEVSGGTGTVDTHGFYCRTQ